MNSTLQNVNSLSRFINLDFYFRFTMQLTSSFTTYNVTCMFSYPQNKTLALAIFEFDILTQNNVTMIAIFQMFTNSKLVFSESRTDQCTCILCQKEKCIALYDIREDDVLYNVSLLFGDFKPYLRVKCFKISAYISSLNLFFLLFVINIIKIAIKTSWFVLLFVFIEEKKQYMQQQTCAINLSYTLHKVTVGLSSLE